MQFTDKIDWDANNEALASKLIEELRNDENIRRVLWRRKEEPHCDSHDKETAAMVVVKALFPLERNEVQLVFYMTAVNKRIAYVRGRFYNVKKALPNGKNGKNGKKGKDIDWEMKTVGGLPVQRKWAEVLRRCPNFRLYAFFNGAITESEIGGSASDIDPLIPSTKPLPPQVDPNAPNAKSAPRSHGGFVAESGEESDETGDEYREEDSGDDDWEEDDEELDEDEIKQGTGNEEVEEEVIVLTDDQAKLRECSTRSASAPRSATPTDRVHPSLQSGKRHREASPHAVTIGGVEFRREQMQLDYNYKLEKRRLKQKEKEKRMELEELDRARTHEERMIDKKIKLARIERKINKG